MSLSARIAVGPSLRAASLAAAAATGGFAVAAITVAARSPDAASLVVAAAVAGWLLALRAIATRHRATPPVVMSVSDHADVGIDRFDQPWRLAEPTMNWSGFSMVALAGIDASGRPARLDYPLFATDVAPSDRRSLSRFLLWSSRGGGAVGGP